MLLGVLLDELLAATRISYRRRLVVVVAMRSGSSSHMLGWWLVESFWPAGTMLPYHVIQVVLLLLPFYLLIFILQPLLLLVVIGGILLSNFQRFRPDLLHVGFVDFWQGQGNFVNLTSTIRIGCSASAKKSAGTAHRLDGLRATSAEMSFLLVILTPSRLHDACACN